MISKFLNAILSLLTIAAFDIDPGHAQEKSGLPAAHDTLAGERPLPTNMHQDELHEERWIQKRLEHRAGMESAPDGYILFIGDSMLQQCGEQLLQIMPRSYNAAIRGESARQLLYRLRNDVSNQNLIHRAGALVIMTFVNDLGDTRSWKNGSSGIENLFGNFLIPRIAKWVTGKAVVVKVINNNLRILEKRVDFNSFGVRTINGLLDEHFQYHPTAKLLNLNPKLSARYPDGSMHLSKRFTEDGIHLNDRGCQILATNIAELIHQD